MRTVAIDLDNTILKYKGWKGSSHFLEPKEGAREAIKKLKDMGFTIIIWTCRSNEDEVARALQDYDIPFDHINENPYGPPNTSNKIYADYYIDDRAIEFKDNWQEIVGRLEEEHQSINFKLVKDVEAEQSR